MAVLNGLKPETLFSYFEEISAIPRGSGVRSGIRDYLVAFAKDKGLAYYTDDADNVIIYKEASKGFENSEPVILQGHTDMVWQKTEDSDIDFEKEGIRLFVDGDFIKAKGTTLGADNGLGVAATLSILADESLKHPPIEAVFTSDEEIGMIGAMKLDMSKLKGKRLINLDAEEPDVLTVSCAGGSDFVIKAPIKRKMSKGTLAQIKISGLTGGHSGIQIAEGRVNADIILGRILNHLSLKTDFEVVDLYGGTKANAIPVSSSSYVLLKDADVFQKEFSDYINIIKEEISEREPDFDAILKLSGPTSLNVFMQGCGKKIIRALAFAPNGVMEMSKEIENLVETSLNLGIMETENDHVKLHFALRSNKESALSALEEKMIALAEAMGFSYETFGHYPPWEFNKNSDLQEIYKKVFKEKTGKEPLVEAIHAGLECGVFSSAIDGFDAIAIGAYMTDVHTVSERLSVSSTEIFYDILVKVLENCR